MERANRIGRSRRATQTGRGIRITSVKQDVGSGEDIADAGPYSVSSSLHYLQSRTDSRSLPDDYCKAASSKSRSRAIAMARIRRYPNVPVVAQKKLEKEKNPQIPKKYRSKNAVLTSSSMPSQNAIVGSMQLSCLVSVSASLTRSSTPNEGLNLTQSCCCVHFDGAAPLYRCGRACDSF